MAYNITSEVIEGEGFITPIGTKAFTAGTDAAYVMTAHEGWEVKDVLVDGASIGSVTEYEFSDIQANHTIKVCFRKTFAHKNAPPILLLKIHHEDGLIRYATTASSTEEGAYLEELIPSGQMRRSFDILGYSFQSNRASIQLQNTDSSFMQLLNDKKLYGSLVEIFVGIEGMDWDEFILTFTGRVLERKIENDKGILTFYDVRPNLPKLPYSTLDASIFQNLPSDHVGKGVPYITGELKQDKGAIDLVKFDSKKYIIASGRALDVTKVYVGGEEKSPSDGTYPWTFKPLARASSFGFYSFIEFTGASDPVDDNKTVTADVKGWGYDYLKLKEFTQITTSGTLVVDSYGLDLDGSSEYAWRDNGFWTSGTSFTIQTRIKPSSFPSSGDVTICVQEQLYDGGQKGIGLYLTSDKKIKLTISKSDHNYVTPLTSTATISGVQFTTIKATFDYTTGRARIYFDTGSGFVQVAGATLSDFAPHVASKMSVGAVWRNSDPPEVPDPIWIQYFNGIIDYVKFAPTAQLNVSEISAPTRRWKFEQNLNDSESAQHLTGVGIISPDDYAIVDSHQEGALTDTYYPFLRVDSGQDSTYKWDTAKKATFGWRFRTPDNFAWSATNNSPTDNFYFIHRNDTVQLRYNIDTNYLSLRFWDGSSWGYEGISTTLDHNPFSTSGEWKELYITVDWGKGLCKIIVDDEILAEGTFTSHTPEFPANQHMFLFGTVGIGAPHPNKVDIDWFGITHAYVGNRRCYRPADDEWKVFVDFSEATGSEHEHPECSLTSLQVNVLADSNGAVNGGTAVIQLGQNDEDSHYYDKELMTGAECILETLHILQEPCESRSFRSVNAVLEALGVNSEGQFGGLVEGSARQLLRDMQSSLDVQLWQGRDARWKLGYHQRDAQAFDATHYSLNENIEVTGWRCSFQSDLKNERRVLWQKSLKDGENKSYHKSGTIKLDTSISTNQLGEQYQDESDLQLVFCRGNALAEHTAKSVIQKQASELPIIEFNSSLVVLQKKPSSQEPQTIGDIIEVTHPNGPGGPAEYGLLFDGSGSDRIFGKNKSWPGSTSFTIQIKGVKLSTALSCWWAKSDDATAANRNFLVYWNDLSKKIAVGISNGIDFEGNLVTADSYTDVGDTVVVKVAYDISLKRIWVYQGSNEENLVEALVWNTGKTINSYNALEGVGSLFASGTTYATCDRIDYVKIAYYCQNNTNTIENPALTLNPSLDNETFLTEERNLLLIPESTKTPEIVKIKEAGCSKKRFYISDLGFDFGSGRSSIKAVSMEDLLDGGIFTIDVDPEDPEPPVPPPPGQEWVYRTYTFTATFKHRQWEWDPELFVLNTFDNNSYHAHGSDYFNFNQYEFRGQIDINLVGSSGSTNGRRISASEEVYEARLDFDSSFGGNIDLIKIYIRTNDVTDISYGDIDAGIGAFCGSVSAGGTSINLSTSAFDHIYHHRNDSAKFTNQPIPKNLINKDLSISVATLTVKTKELVE